MCCIKQCRNFCGSVLCTGWKWWRWLRSWILGAPEAQPQSNRTAYFSSDSAPHTDVVSLSAAALAMQYKNFGGDKYLKTAEMLLHMQKITISLLVQRLVAFMYLLTGKMIIVWQRCCCIRLPETQVICLNIISIKMQMQL